MLSKIEKFCRSFLINIVIRRIGLPVLFFFDGLIIRISRKRGTPEPSVAFVRTDNLGDMILWLPAMKSLAQSQACANKRLILVGNSQWTSLPMVRSIFDEIIPIELRRLRGNLPYRWSLLKALSRRNVEAVYNSIVTRESITSDTLSRAISAPIKFAALPKIDPMPRTLGPKNNWYNRYISVDGTAHELIHNSQFTEGVTGVAPAAPWPRLFAADRPASLLDKPYAIFAPGCGSNPIKAWNPTAFAEVANWVAAYYGFAIIVTGTAAERSTVDVFKRACQVPVIDQCGTMGLSDVIDIIGSASLVVTNETGISHLGAAAHVPTLVVLGGGSFGKFMPYPEESSSSGIRLKFVYSEMECYKCAWDCIHPLDENLAAPCVNQIGVDMVRKSIEELIPK